MFDYIGSSRMVYDMMNGDFPFKMNPGDRGVRPVNVTNFTAWLEVSQVGLINNESKLWVHSDFVNRDQRVGHRFSPAFL